MHSTSWQAVCGFFTDVYESLECENISMRYIFEMICQYDNEKFALWIENGKKRQLTYSDLREMCSSAAQKMDTLIPGCNGVVALHMENSAMWPVLFWAILMSGHVPLLLNAALPLKTFRSVLERTDVVAVISSEEEAGTLHPSCLLKGTVRADMALFEQRWEDRVIFMTSGTSGVSKLIVYDGKAIAKQIQSCRYFYRDTTEIAYPKSMGSLRQLALLPFSHIFGFIICVIWYPYFGRQIVYPQSLSPKDVMSACQKMHVTHLCAVPGYFDAFVQIMLNAANGLFGKHADGFTAYLLEGQLQSAELFQRYQNFAKKLCAYVLGGDMRYLISGGGALSPATAAFFNRLGLCFCNGYGMTELGILAVEKSESAEKRMQAAIGYPSYGVDFTIDASGELLVDCDYAAAGYWENDAVVPLERPFPTRDIARQLRDGRYMIIGRCDDIIIDSNGNRVHPWEIEESLIGICGTPALCVIPYGKKLIAILEMNPTGDTDKIAQSINRANELSPISHYIHEAWICPKLHRTAKGEINRKHMRAEYETGLSEAIEIPIVHPSSVISLDMPMLESIRKKVAAVLSIAEEQVLPESNFFSELSMDSLAYMCFIQWLEEEYRISFMIPDKPRFESINQCVEYIHNRRSGGV